MIKQTSGIHHITAIVGHPQENLDFYEGILGLRLVKQTVNFDDPGTYHLYFGDKGGKPGTIITFFPWATAKPGTIGDGQVGVTSYAIPQGAMAFWKERLASFHIPYHESLRFGELVLQFNDVHNLKLELVERAEGELNTWEVDGISANVAIKGFAGAILYSSHPQQTADVLTRVMGLKFVAHEGEYSRFQSTASIGNIIDLKNVPGTQGNLGPGTVHHIAFRANDNDDQLSWQQHARTNGMYVTDVRDRNYFNAIYFREPGDILIEIATDPPGFSYDEPLEEMGTKLMLPAQYEGHRERLELMLIPLERKIKGKLK